MYVWNKNFSVGLFAELQAPREGAAGAPLWGPQESRGGYEPRSSKRQWAIVHEVFIVVVIISIAAVSLLAQCVGTIRRARLTGAIATGPPLQRGPRDDIYLFQIKYSFENVSWFKRDTRIQLYIPMLHCVSLMISLQVWILPVLVITTEYNIFGFVQCKYAWILLVTFPNNRFFVVYLLVHHAYSTNDAKTILFASAEKLVLLWLLFSINDSVTSCAVWR